MQIKITKVGKYIGAVTSGRCPFCSILPDNNKYADWIASIKEDYPKCDIVWGDMKDKRQLSQFIIRQQNSR